MVGETLTTIRKNLGFKSARAFYNDHLGKNTNLEFNYSYYMKIEGDRIIPSPQVISNISKTLTPDAAEALILSYCKIIFPQKAGLFNRSKKIFGKKLKQNNQPDLGEKTILKQHYLSLSQIDCISKSKFHYFIFLILTLARKSVDRAEMRVLVPFEKRNDVYEDLVKVKLIKIEGEFFSSICNEMVFPKSDSEYLKKTYQQLDLWDLEFPIEMGFENQIKKTIIRRVSRRYLGMIRAQINFILDLVRASDEVNTDFNEEVVMLNISIEQGNLPG